MPLLCFLSLMLLCPALVCRVGQQSDVARPFDGFGQHALVARADARQTARGNFAAFRHIALQQAIVFEVNQIHFVTAKAANFADMAPPPVHASTPAAFVIVLRQRIINIVVIT